MRKMRSGTRLLSAEMVNRLRHGIDKPMTDDEWNQGASRTRQMKCPQNRPDGTRHNHAASPLRNVAGTKPNGLCEDRHNRVSRPELLRHRT